VARLPHALAEPPIAPGTGDTFLGLVSMIVSDFSIAVTQDLAGILDLVASGDCGGDGVAPRVAAGFDAAVPWL